MRDECKAVLRDCIECDDIQACLCEEQARSRGSLLFPKYEPLIASKLKSEGKKLYKRHKKLDVDAICTGNKIEFNYEEPIVNDDSKDKMIVKLLFTLTCLDVIINSFVELLAGKRIIYVGTLVVQCVANIARIVFWLRVHLLKSNIVVRISSYIFMGYICLTIVNLCLIVFSYRNHSRISCHSIAASVAIIKCVSLFTYIKSFGQFVDKSS
ncbi:hypothetical protein GJ496_008388 [Pomphorhynchus laevis]|nr:hypothetical protein GJ496_008388 [Pomphorhynchus laevis]